MLAPGTDLARWKAAHVRPVVINHCRWNQAVEATMRANMDAWFALSFLWPRIVLRTVLGV